ncbi:MAG: hypothetical protein ACRDOL_40730 [Streptosporangiaceae bacterium]
MPTSRAAAVARLTAARHADGDRKAGQVRDALAQFERDSAAFTVAGLARAAGVSRRFLYARPELAAEIGAARMRIAAARATGPAAAAAATAATLRADLEAALAVNAQLRLRLAAAGQSLAELRAGADPGRTPDGTRHQPGDDAGQH